MVEFRRGPYLISTDPHKLDLHLVHRFLSESSYWAQGRPYEVVEQTIRHSLCFGLFAGSRQIGFARVITDRATFAYLADVFILEAHRGQGLGTWLVSCILQHPDLQDLGSWMLATADAHGLYAKFGFKPLASPERYMVRRPG